MISAQTSLAVTTLGRFEVRRDLDAVNGGRWKRRKVWDLFKLLLSADRHRLHREQIQEILWPSSANEQAASSFGKTLYLLRRALEPELPAGQGSSSTYVTLDHDILQLPPGSMSIDADLFEAEARQLQVRLRSGAAQEPGMDRRALLDEFDRVSSLYEGDFLPEDLYEDWAQRRRARLRRVHSWLLENAAQLAVENAMGARACEYLQALLEYNHTDEPAHHQLMLVYARLGRRSEALRQFQLLCSILREELHANPMPETVELYRTIQEGQVPADLAPGLRAAPQRKEEYIL
jgi:LuxR family maltose regulon positive regulatory protein